MPLPQPAEYNDAIQNPRLAFVDSELRIATFDGHLQCGMPWPEASGNFAIVYRFQSGTRRLAVKCFTREKTDQQLRYQLIHEYLAAQKLPWMIDFTYIKEGIRVNGRLHPIVKMEWIENPKTLLLFINESLSAGKPLDSVCDQFYRMAADLKKNSIAHGDLQHANLIISGRKLLLIDYDGMCVPKTEGLRSEEDGLPDYQHPRRHGGTLQTSMDHFSTLVIWTSLHALTIDPTLWRRWVRDDERLLFRSADFTRPDNSELIRELLSFRDPKMTSAVEAIVKAAAATSLDQVPHLVDVVTDVASSDTTPWWQPMLTAPAEHDRPHGFDGTKLLPSWIATSSTPRLPPVVFTGRSLMLSFYSAITMASVLVAGIVGVGGTVALPAAFVWAFATLALYAAVIHVVFVKRPEVAMRAAAKKRLSEAIDDNRRATSLLRLKREPHLKMIAEQERKIVVAETRIKELELAIDNIKKEGALKLQNFARHIAEKLSEAEKAERNALLLLNAQRASAVALYDSLLSQIGKELDTAETLFTINSRLLSSRATREREAKFAAKFDAFIQEELGKISIGRAPVAGVNTHEMNRCGFFTLADFDGYSGDGSLRNKNGRFCKVSGIGSVRGRELFEWRKATIESLKVRVPAVERDAINQAVDADIRKERGRLELIRDRARSEAANAKSRAKADHQRTLIQAARNEEDAKSFAKATKANIMSDDTKFGRKIAELEASELAPLTRELGFLQSVVNPGRYLIKAERAKMHAESTKLSREVTSAHEKVGAATQDVERFAQINYAKFIKFILEVL